MEQDDKTVKIVVNYDKLGIYFLLKKFKLADPIQWHTYSRMKLKAYAVQNGVEMNVNTCNTVKELKLMASVKIRKK